MKKLILLAMGLGLLSTSAFATKARMNSLGQDTDRGSFYIDDTRNVFRNAANAGSTTNYVVTEWGDGTASNPEGGFFREMGSFGYGVYLGSDINDRDAAASASGIGATGFAGRTLPYGAAGAANDQNDLDFFFAGDMGVQWGARIHYSKNSDKNSGLTGNTNQEATHKELGLGFGIVFGDLEASLNVDLSNEYEGDVNSTDATKGKFEGDTGIDLEVTYDMGNWTFVAGYAKAGFESNYASPTGTTTTKNKSEQTVLSVGAGHTHTVSSSARIYSDIRYLKTSAEDTDGADTNAASNKTELDDSELNLNIAFEADANSWLTLRGSITQTVFINKREQKTGNGTASLSHVNGGPTVAAGATLNFGKLKIDGTISNSFNEVTSTGTGTQTTTSSRASELRLDKLMANVAVHYWF